MRCELRLEMRDLRSCCRREAPSGTVERKARFALHISDALRVALGDCPPQRFMATLGKNMQYEKYAT